MILSTTENDPHGTSWLKRQVEKTSDDIEGIALVINVSLRHSACLQWEISWESTVAHWESGGLLNKTSFCFLHHTLHHPQVSSPRLETFVEDFPMCLRMFGNILGLYPLDASRCQYNILPPSFDNQNCFLVLPNINWGPMHLWWTPSIRSIWIFV